MTVLASILTGLAAALHVVIFVMESVRWRSPAVWRRFGVADQGTADLLRPMAYNQGFYNLFLAVGAAVGVVLVAVGGDAAVAGRALAVFSLACMAGAAVVLTTTGPGYTRAALTQGTVPALGLVAWLLA